MSILGTCELLMVIIASALATPSPDIRMAWKSHNRAWRIQASSFVSMSSETWDPFTGNWSRIVGMLCASRYLN